MMKTWRDDGFGYDKLELWAIGYPGSESSISGFTNGSDESCFADESNSTRSAYKAFHAQTDALFVRDMNGEICYSTNLAEHSMSVKENRKTLDDTVRSLIP